jgi:radical SAM superfamily enzyme YgiQ (UPF0313 family)
MGAWSTWGRHIAININHAQLAANLREWYPHININVLDCRAIDFDEKKMLSAIEEIKPNLIYMGDAIQSNGVAAMAAKHQDAARLIKETMPDVKICAGGFYYGANASLFLPEIPEFDYIISGETEVTFTELANELGKADPDIESVKGLAFRNNGDVKLTPYRPLFENLDDLPFPAYDLFPMDKYVGYTNMKNYTEMYASRGCPNGCKFCVCWTNYDTRGNRDWTHRIRSGDLVAEEISMLEKKYNVKFLILMDEDFNVYRDRMVEFIEGMKRRDVNVKYCMLGRSPYYLRDKDLLPELRKTGLVFGLFGLEAVDKKTLKSIEKRITVEQVKETIDCFRENGIMSVVTWMVGFPDDDEETIQERFKYIDTIDPDVISLQILTPLEGIPIARELTPYIEDFDKHKWDFHHAVIRTKHISREELGRLAAWCNSEFFSKPGRVQRILYDERFDTYAKLFAKSYVETMGIFEKAAVSGKQII